MCLITRSRLLTYEISFRGIPFIWFLSFHVLSPRHGVQQSINAQFYLYVAMAPAASSAECSPLLRPSHEDDSEAASIKSHGHQPATSRRLAVAIPCLLLLAAVEIGVKLLTVPMAQIQEGIICRGHYPDVVETPEDPRCKDEVVQSDLSMLQGWEMTFALIPGLLTAVPYGIMADRYGRKVTLSLSLLGMTMVEAAEIVICRPHHTVDPGSILPEQFIEAGLTR